MKLSMVIATLAAAIVPAVAQVSYPVLSQFQSSTIVIVPVQSLPISVPISFTTTSSTPATVPVVVPTTSAPGSATSTVVVSPTSATSSAASPAFTGAANKNAAAGGLLGVAGLAAFLL